MNNNRKLSLVLTASAISILAFGLSGCADIEYKYDIPDGPAQCEGSMIYRDGGSNIVDRDNGANIRDRDGNEVDAYCEEADCPGGNWSADPPVIDWHLTKGKYVVANRKCLAVPR